MSLSVTIIVHNEEQHIRACLESVAWADEIIVVDSGSTDATLVICQMYTTNVFSETDWQGFGVQKNRALQHASHDWVLSIDADERVSPALRTVIEIAMQRTDIVGWRIPRLSNYCGRFMRHSGWYPDKVLRLFRHSAGQFSNDMVHERVIVDGKIDDLDEPLIHYTYTDLDEMLIKLNAYSSAGAQQAFEQGKRASLSIAVFKGLWAFIRTYLLRLGFLDGREGFLLAVSNAETTYYRYLKLMYLQEQAEKQ